MINRPAQAGRKEGQMKGVSCVFENSSREYSFLLDPRLDASVEAGDQLVVEAAGKNCVVTVRSVSPSAPKIATRFAFQKVESERVETLRRWAMELDQAEQVRKALVAKLNRKLESRSAMDRYAEMAKDDPEAARLLEELKGIALPEGPAE